MYVFITSSTSALCVGGVLVSYLSHVCVYLYCNVMVPVASIDMRRVTLTHANTHIHTLTHSLKRASASGGKGPGGARGAAALDGGGGGERERTDRHGSDRHPSGATAACMPPARWQTTPAKHIDVTPVHKLTTHTHDTHMHTRTHSHTLKLTHTLRTYTVTTLTLSIADSALFARTFRTPVDVAWPRAHHHLTWPRAYLTYTLRAHTHA